MKKQKKKFKLFDMNRDGKGVYEKENRKPTLKFFFKLLFRKFGQLLRLNVLMLFQVLPLIVVACIFLLGNKTTLIQNPAFVPLYGIEQISSSPSLLHDLDFSSFQSELPVHSPVVNVIIIVLFLFLAITWGWQNVGTTYCLRGLFRGDPVFIFQDYFYAIKRNLKQGFFLGLIDFACSAVLIMDFLYFYFRTGKFGLDVMYFMIFAIALIYVIMRFYIYHLLITFDLSIFKILKNALIFSILGVKRNILAILGIVLLLGLHIGLIILLIPIGISIPLILPFVYALAVLAFMGTYAAYPMIDRYMIAPYAQAETEEPEEAIAPIESEDTITESETE